MIAARDLNQWVELHNPPPDADQDEYGQEARRFELLANVWAKVEPLAGREFFAAQQQQRPASMRVTIRFRADITARTRVIWRGQAFELVADPIDTLGARVELQLMCVGAPDV